MIRMWRMLIVVLLIIFSSVSMQADISNYDDKEEVILNEYNEDTFLQETEGIHQTCECNDDHHFDCMPNPPACKVREFSVY